MREAASGLVDIVSSLADISRSEAARDLAEAQQTGDRNLAHSTLMNLVRQAPATQEERSRLLELMDSSTAFRQSRS